MLKNSLSLMLIGLLLNLTFYTTANAGNLGQKTKQELTIKEKVNKLGENQKVKITLLDGRKLKGFIKEIKPDSFILVDSYKLVGSAVVAVDKTNSAGEIQFSQIKQIKSGVGTPEKVIGVPILIAFGAGLLFLISLPGRN